MSNKINFLTVSFLLLANILQSAPLKTAIRPDTAKLNYLYNIVLKINNDDVLFQTYEDSIILELKKGINYDESARYYNLKGSQYLNHYKFDSALIFLNKSLAIESKIKNPEIKIYTHLKLGLCLKEVGRLNEAIAHSLWAYKTAKRIGNLKKVGQISIDISNSYRLKWDLDSAYYYIQIAERYFSKIKDTIGIIVSGNSKAILYRDMDFFNKSIAQYYQLIKLDTQFEEFDLLSTIYLNLGDMYARFVYNPDSALYFLNKCIIESMKNKNEYFIAAAKLNIANIYNLKKDYRKVINTLIEIRNSPYNSIRVSAIINTGAAMRHLKMDSAYFFISKGIEESKEFQLIEYQHIGLEHLYKLDSIKGDFKQAFNHYQEFIAIEDSLNSAANSNQIAQLENEFALITAAQEKEFWKIKSEAANEALRRKSATNTSMIIFSLLMIALFIFLIILSTKKRKFNKALSTFNIELQAKNKELRAVNKMKNMLFSVLSHDLKSNISPSNQLLHILAEENNGLTEIEKKNLFNCILSSSDNVMNLMNNLLEWIRIQHDSYKHQLKKVDLFIPLKETIESQILAAPKINIKITNEIPEGIYIFSNKDIVKTIFRNLLSNSIKYTPSGGEINIKGYLEDHFYKVRLSDTGIGMTPETAKRIFDFSSQHSSLGINKEKGSGFGLKLVHQMIVDSQGKIEVESQPGVGTVFTVSFRRWNNSSN